MKEEEGIMRVTGTEDNPRETMRYIFLHYFYHSKPKSYFR